MVVIGWLYDRVAREREGGTLALLASSGAAVGKLFLLRFLGLYLLLCGLVLGLNFFRPGLV
ncbi:MAG: hypothetical protein HC821_00760 [Lewinella sp.]|nr:hypothetical protein [Lewinella sp.]